MQFVAEVIETDKLVRLAWSPPRVVGLCSYRQEVIPVVALGALACDGRVELPAGGKQAGTRRVSWAPAGIDQPTRFVVLIVKTEHGIWGIRVGSENVIMSQQPVDQDVRRMNADGPVFVGTVQHEGSCYEILDAEATWHGLRSAVGRWAGRISESSASPPPACDEDQIQSAWDDSRGHREM
jgi:chemotaxis signal transduction protein